MKPASRVIACLLAVSLCSSSFAQSLPSLQQVQTKAKQQVAQTPWMKRYLLPLTAIGIGGGALLIKQFSLARQNKQLRAETQKLTQAIKDYQHYSSRLYARNEALAWKLEQAQNRAKTAEQILQIKNKSTTPKPPKMSLVQKFMPSAKTDLSKRLLTENTSLFYNMPEEEIKALLREVDLLAKQKPAQALLNLNRLTWQASHITRKQAFIAVEKYIKGFAVTALLFTLAFPAADAQAQTRLSRLEQNPALFLQADADQLKAWEKNPRANALCRKVAEVIDQAYSLKLTDEEAQTFTLYAAKQAAAQKKALRQNLRKQLVR